MFKTELNKKFEGKVVRCITNGPDFTQIEFENVSEYLYISNGKLEVITVTSK